jgi:predicted TPR repeat methyltransferase
VWNDLRLGPPPGAPNGPTVFTLWARGEHGAARAALGELLGDANASVERLRGAASLSPTILDARASDDLARRIAVLETERLGVARAQRDEVVEFKLAVAAGSGAPERAPPAYVAALFDRAAREFDEQLVDRLDYQGPRLIGDAIERALGRDASELDVLDIGCGTGLLGPRLRTFARRLEGVDCAPRMLEVARAKGVYDRLDAGDLLDVLAARPDRYDLVVAGDVLIYFGDLAPVFAAAAIAVREGGHFTFSVEASDAGGSVLRANARYAHSRDHVLALSREREFEVALDEAAVLRTEQGEPVAFRIFVLRLLRKRPDAE